VYLHTRLLLGIGTVTLVALVISVMVPLESVRTDVSRETDASMQLAQLLLDVQRAVNASASSGAAQTAAEEEIRRARDIRHVKVSLVNERGTVLAASPAADQQPGGLGRALVSGEDIAPPLTYRLAYHDAPLAEIQVSSNPWPELAEIEQRVLRDLALLTLTIIAMATAIYYMVRRGLQPITQIQVALAGLQAGAFQTRLPHFRLRDMDDISTRFNQCAAAMEAASVQRRDMNRRIIEAEEQERKRLARELHDELGQSLTAIKVDAAYIAREARDTSGRIVGIAQGIERLSSDIMELIRSMLVRLRPHGLETAGLKETLQELINGWQERVAARFQCTLRIEGDVDLLPPELNITIYRLVQECLTNAVRHSRARRILIRLLVSAATPTGLTIDVTESEVAANNPALSNSGVGLLGMRERVEAHGGELQVAFDANGGLALHAWLPTAPAPYAMTV
jgi:two-component system, NarL family, sensor histidine kinase UhpB